MPNNISDIVSKYVNELYCTRLCKYNDHRIVVGYDQRIVLIICGYRFIFKKLML